MTATRLVLEQVCTPLMISSRLQVRRRRPTLPPPFPAAAPPPAEEAPLSLPPLPKTVSPLPAEIAVPPAAILLLRKG